MTEMSPSRLIWIGWIATLALALWLRLHDLDLRPIHADEATGAKILTQRLEGANYSFDPKHFHGPLPGAIAASIATIRGEQTGSDLRLSTLRMGPVIAGLCTVLAPLLWIRRFAASATLAAAALLASSPLIVYYNRMYIHESWLLLFGILSLASLHRLIRKPNWLTASLAGLCIGLMFATKETFAISMIAWGIAGFGLFLSRRQLAIRDYRSPLVWFATIGFVAFVTGSFFYSDGFRNWQGVVDSVRTYFVYETTPGHEKPTGYYMHTLLWPKQILGAWWTEICVALLAATALLRGMLQRSNFGPYLFLTLATLAHFVIYSWIDYKTPWLMLLPWAHVCLLASLAFNDLHALRPSLKIALVLLFVGITSFQTQQSLRATGRSANDERNPYAYVPTSRDPVRIGHWLKQIQALPDSPPLHPIAVIGKNYWPLPWYLREFETVGYWNKPNPELSQLPIVFVMPQHIAECDTLLQTSHQKFPRTLRANVPVMLYLRRDICSLWIQSPTP